MPFVSFFVVPIYFQKHCNCTIFASYSSFANIIFIKVLLSVNRSIDDKKTAKNLKSILTKINIEPIKFHWLRHTYATRLFKANVPPKTVQVLMGHYDINITLDIYTHVMKDTKLEAIEKLNEIFAL